MTEISGELIFETLKKIQNDVSSVKTTVSELKMEMNSMRGVMIATQNDIHNIYAILTRHDDRLDRIERRLELREIAETGSKFDHDT